MRNWTQNVILPPTYPSLFQREEVWELEQSAIEIHHRYTFGLGLTPLLVAAVASIVIQLYQKMSILIKSLVALCKSLP